MAPPRGKYWVWTLNNWTEEERSHIDSSVEDNSDVGYICYGVERGEEGTPHLQGYLELAIKLRLGGVKLIRGLGRAHFELRKGNQTQAVDYCRKDDDFHQFGALFGSSQGRRSDLDSIKELLDSGATDLTISDEHFGSFIRYNRGIAAYRALRNRRTTRPLKVVVLWGPPGTGKTGYVFAREPSLWISSDPTLKWFDGYRGESAVLLDDFHGECASSFILRLLDIYPFQVPIKGGWVDWVPDRIYITSNIPPPFGMFTIEAALLRRLHVTYQYTSLLDFEHDADGRIAALDALVDPIIELD